jgi:hypothetical protein
MRGVDVLVLLAERQPWAIPAKAYEYLAAGTRILACCEADGATGRLLQGVGRARVVSGQEPGALKAAIMEYVRARDTAGRARPDRAGDSVDVHVESHLARLCEVLDAL